MPVNRPTLRQPASPRRSAPRIAAARGSIAVQSAGAPKTWHKERRRGVIAAVTVAVLFGASLCAYGIRTHMAQVAARAAERDLQAARATGATLRSVEVLFVPEYGSTCQRRWLNNTTWTLRDGGKVECDEEAAWNSSVPPREHNVERRIDAIRNVFQARAGGKIE
jgi:hypothetical protein